MGLLYFVIGVIVGTLPLIALVERPRAAPAVINRSAFVEQRGVMQGRVLAPHRIVERVFEAARPLPLGGRADSTIAADLVDAPIDFEPMIVGVAEFDRKLAAGAAAALEIDLDAMPAQMVASPYHFVEGRDLKGNVVQLDILRRRIRRTDKRDAVMVGVAAQKHHAARHHLLGIDVGDLEPQHLGIEPRRTFDILHIEHDMPDLADAERQTVRPLRPQPFYWRRSPA